MPSKKKNTNDFKRKFEEAIRVHDALYANLGSVNPMVVQICATMGYSASNITSKLRMRMYYEQKQLQLIISNSEREATIPSANFSMSEKHDLSEKYPTNAELKNTETLETENAEVVNPVPKENESLSNFLVSENDEILHEKESEAENSEFEKHQADSALSTMETIDEIDQMILDGFIDKRPNDFSWIPVKDLKGLFVTHGDAWLTGEVVDVLLSSREKQTQLFDYIGSNFSCNIITGKPLTENNICVNSYEPLTYNYNKPYIVMPFYVGKHWSLCIATIQDYTLRIINPYFPNNDSNMYPCSADILEKFQNFTNMIHSGKFLNGKWKMGGPVLKKLTTQSEEDKINCGVHVVSYVDAIFSGIEETDVDTKRNNLQQEILAGNYVKVRCQKCHCLEDITDARTVRKILNNGNFNSECKMCIDAENRTSENCQEILPADHSDPGVEEIEDSLLSSKSSIDETSSKQEKKKKKGKKDSGKKKTRKRKRNMRSDAGVSFLHEVKCRVKDLQKNGRINTYRVRQCIRKVCNQRGMTCVLSFKATNIKGGYVYARAQCKHDKEHLHDNKPVEFRFRIYNCSRSPRISGHTNCGNGWREFDHKGSKFPPLCSPERSIIQNQLETVMPDVMELQLVKDCNEDQNEKGNPQNWKKLSVLQKARSERRVSKYFVKDCLLHSALECHIRFPQYVQEFSTPLQLHMYCEIQQRMILQMKKTVDELILYYDATSSLIRNRCSNPNCGHELCQIMYHAGVIQMGKRILPAMEFISAKNDILHVSNFLRNYVNYLKNKLNISIWPIFKVVVTDHSWVMIRSIIESFNANMNLAIYLRILHDHLTKGTSIDNMTLIFICCAHFMKIIVNKIKEKVTPHNNEPDFKVLVKKCFALMIDCTDFLELQVIFRKFAFILCSPTLSTNVIEELNLISRQDFKSNVVAQVLKEEHCTNDTGNDFESMFEQNFCESNKKPMYEQSPFYQIFKNILEEVQNEIGQEVSGSTAANPYHATDFAGFITKHYMPYVVLWTAIIIGKRYSNALGENFFRMIKHVWIPERNLEVSAFVQQQHEFVENALKRVRLEGVYLQTPKTPAQEKSTQKTTTSLGLEVSMKRKLKNSDPINSHQPSKRAKSEPSQSQDPLNDKQQERWRHRMKKKSTAFTSPYTPTFGEKRKTKRNIGVVNSMPTIVEENEISNTSQEIISFENNGLVKEASYYNLYAGKKISFPLAKFDLGAKTPWTVNYKDFRTLDYKSWLSGNIVDILMKLRCQKYQTFEYIDHATTKKIIEGETMPNKQIADSSSSRIVATYCKGSHWYLMVADVDNKYFIVVDPKNPNNTAKQIEWKSTFVAYLKAVFQISDENWKFGYVKPSQVELPIQKIGDAQNCGIFIIMYVDMMFGKCVTQEPIALRYLYQSEILEKSKPMIHFCLFCGKNIEKLFIKVLCSRCHRWQCSKCVKNLVSDNDFECFICKGNPLAPEKIIV
jgi:hypothetical protein